MSRKAALCARLAHLLLSPRPVRNGRGQVAVEAALAGPLVVLLGLGILQLGLVQQARVLVEYAAFAAARAGVVWGADGARMHDAALLVLLPVMARADSWEAVAASWPEVRRKDLAMHALLKDARAPGLPPLMEAAGLAGLVRVDVVGPRASDGEGEEIDFDLPDAFGEGPGLRASSDRFTRPLGEEPDQDALRAATRLTVRVRYLHELQIPLAGWAVFTCWMATHPGLEGELEVLERLAREERRYFLPLGATYALRMQSSVQRKWLAR